MTCRTPGREMRAGRRTILARGRGVGKLSAGKHAIWTSSAHRKVLA